MPPKRIQRKVATGFRLPKRTVYVGLPTRWENWIIPGRVSKSQYLPIKTSGLAALKFREVTDHTLIHTLYVKHHITREEAASWHRKWLVDGCSPAEIIPWWNEIDNSQKFTDIIMETRRQTLADIGALRGEDLASWTPLCPEHPDGLPLGVHCTKCAPCHTDTLMEIANR